MREINHIPILTILRILVKGEAILIKDIRENKVIEIWKIRIV